MIRYTEKMIQDAKNVDISPDLLYPIFNTGSDRTYIVKTLIGLKPGKRDMSIICIYDKDKNLTTIPTNINKNWPDEVQYKKILKQIADTIVELNKDSTDGYYIMWGTNNFFEIKYFSKESLSLNGRLYEVLGQGELRFVSTHLEESSWSANVAVSIGVLFILVIFFSFLLINIIRMLS